MKILIITSILLIFGCNDNDRSVSTVSTFIPDSPVNIEDTIAVDRKVYVVDTTICNTDETVFFKLSDPVVQTDFFRQLDEIIKKQYPDHDLDTLAFVDISPGMLSRFLRDINREQFKSGGEFEKEYHFNKAPKPYKDPKECSDMISVHFNHKNCSFTLNILNRFLADWCQESNVIYTFRIVGDRIRQLTRNEAG